MNFYLHTQINHTILGVSLIYAIVLQHCLALAPNISCHSLQSGISIAISTSTSTLPSPSIRPRLTVICHRMSGACSSRHNTSVSVPANALQSSANCTDRWSRLTARVMVGLPASSVLRLRRETIQPSNRVHQRLAQSFVDLTTIIFILEEHFKFRISFFILVRFRNFLRTTFVCL